MKISKLRYYVGGVATFAIIWSLLLGYKLLLPETFSNTRAAPLAELCIWLGWPFLIVGLFIEHRNESKKRDKGGDK